MSRQAAPLETVDVIAAVAPVIVSEAMRGSLASLVKDVETFAGW